MKRESEGWPLTREPGLLVVITSHINNGSKEIIQMLAGRQ